MIDEEKLARIRTGAAFAPAVQLGSQLDTMDTDELLRLRAQIDARLPATRLSEMNLEEELVRQFLKVQALQDSVLEDDAVPANQRSQVAGQVASTLQQLVKMQSEFHTAERFKAIENLMIKYFKRLPLDVVEKFLEEYEALGND